MARADHISPFEAERIRALASRGLSRAEIARRVKRSSITVWRVLSGRRCPPVWPENRDAENGISEKLEMLKVLSLEMRIGSAPNKEADIVTPEIVRTVFIDALTPHFALRRLASERFLADLVAALLDEKFSEATLILAARSIYLRRTTTTFPTVAACIAACKIAEGELRASDSTPTPSDAEAA